jgi:NMD protein affecting ribosome stability and mRNA decay
MSKKPISWVELVTSLSKERKAKGLSGGIKDVMDDAKKEWSEIKNGTHSKYVVGPPPKRTKTRSKTKTKKTLKNKKQHNYAVEMLDKCKLCSRCQKKLNAFIP